jgi:hypothetical protein
MTSCQSKCHSLWTLPARDYGPPARAPVQLLVHPILGAVVRPPPPISPSAPGDGATVSWGELHHSVHDDLVLAVGTHHLLVGTPISCISAFWNLP